MGQAGGQQALLSPGSSLSVLFNLNLLLQCSGMGRYHTPLTDEYGKVAELGLESESVGAHSLCCVLHLLAFLYPRRRPASGSVSASVLTALSRSVFSLLSVMTRVGGADAQQSCPKASQRARLSLIRDRNTS